MLEALKPIIKLGWYKISDSTAIREFYSLLRAAIKSAQTVWHLRLLINDQTSPNTMGKMPLTD